MMSEEICKYCAETCELHGEEPESTTYCPGNNRYCEVYRRVAERDAAVGKLAQVREIVRIAEISGDVCPGMEKIRGVLR